MPSAGDPLPPGAHWTGTEVLKFKAEFWFTTMPQCAQCEAIIWGGATYYKRSWCVVISETNTQQDHWQDYCSMECVDAHEVVMSQETRWV